MYLDRYRFKSSLWSRIFTTNTHYPKVINANPRFKLKMKPKTNSLWFKKKISKIFKFFHALWTNENETWKIEKLKDPGNRFSTYAQIIGCNKKSMRPKNIWIIEISNDTLIVKFPQLLIPLLYSFFQDTLYIYMSEDEKTTWSKLHILVKVLITVGLRSIFAQLP